MSAPYSPGIDDFFDMSHRVHSTKKLRRTPKERQPPKLRHRSFKATRRLFPHDANEISYQPAGNLLSLNKLPKSSPDISYYRQNFDEICPIGAGSFGEVFKVRCKTTGHYYAIKKSKERFHSPLDRMGKLEEVRKHELIPVHDNCVQFIRAWEEDDYLYIQLELCKTSLEEYTLVHHELKDTMLWDILLDISLAVKHLHDNNFLHLDIKLENILMALDGRFKLGDFGLLSEIPKDIVNDWSEGDSKYLAPEVMQGFFTKSADIFSLGITMLELATDLDLPSRGPLWHELRNGIFPDDHISNICPVLFSIIKRMMAPDMVDRPDIDDVLAHPELQKLMYKRRRFRYFTQMISQVQLLVSKGCAALKTVMGSVLLPLGAGINGYLNRSRGDMENSYSEDDDGGRSTPINSANSSHLFNTSPSMSPIRGVRRVLFDASAPDILVTNSTPMRTPPSTPRKRGSDSLDDDIEPLNGKRMCVSHGELGAINGRNGLRVRSHSVHHRLKRPGVRNLLPLFRSCELES